MSSRSRRARRLLAVAVLGLAGAPANAQEDEDEALVVEALVVESNGIDLARDARAVLEARCVSCHNPDAEDPKAVRSWSDALDVQAMIDDVVIEPDSAAQSYLLELIDEGEMPPPDSEVEPVTEAQRATLLAWISAGAPSWPDGAAASDGADDGAPTAQDDELSPTEPTPPPANQEVSEASDPTFDWRDLGVLHPALVHFPVGLLLAAVFAELLVACGATGVRTASRFCAWLGFFGALAASATGWLRAEVTVDRQGLLEPHRWLGVASVVAGLLLALSLEGRTRGGGSRPLHVALVVATAVLVSLAAHWGGTLAWGSDHFSDLTFLPAFLR